MDSSESTGDAKFLRRIIIFLIIFNAIGIGLSEIQRRTLVQNSLEQVAETNKVLDRLFNRLIAVQSEVRFLRARDIDSPVAEKQLKQMQVIQLLKAGVTITIQFDENSKEAIGSNGRVICGSDAAKSYLGIFIAGQRYYVRYDAATHRWTATGPSQLLTLDDYSKTCSRYTASYGPLEQKETVTAESGSMILWGAKFLLSGAAVEFEGARVGEVVGLD